jgi:hypothetical protein
VGIPGLTKFMRFEILAAICLLYSSLLSGGETGAVISVCETGT